MALCKLIYRFMEYTTKDRNNFPCTTGIYSINFKNDTSNKIYIGSASRDNNYCNSANGFYNRWSKHIYRLRKNIIKYNKLQEAYNEFGEENMIFKIIEECEPDKCIEREQFYIDKYESFTKGYNGCPLSNNNKGFKQTQKHKCAIYDKYKKKRDDLFPNIEKLYNEGKTTREISDILKISRNVIKKIFKENLIKPKKVADYTKRKIYQYDMNGELIKDWNSINQCSNENQFNSNSIRLVLNGTCKQCKGFYFSDKLLSKLEVIEKIKSLSINRNRKYSNILQMDQNGGIIKEWEDVKEIIKTGEFSLAICRYLSKESTYYKGYYWKLK